MWTDLPAVGHGGVRDQNRADRSDPHALVDDAVQVGQPAAVRHTHRTITAHVVIQLPLHALLDLRWKPKVPTQDPKDVRVSDWERPEMLLKYLKSTN